MKVDLASFMETAGRVAGARDEGPSVAKQIEDLETAINKLKMGLESKPDGTGGKIIYGISDPDVESGFKRILVGPEDVSKIDEHKTFDMFV